MFWIKNIKIAFQKIHVQLLVLKYLGTDDHYKKKFDNPRYHEQFIVFILLITNPFILFNTDVNNKKWREIYNHIHFTKHPKIKFKNRKEYEKAVKKARNYSSFFSKGFRTQLKLDAYKLTHCVSKESYKAKIKNMNEKLEMVKGEK